MIADIKTKLVVWLLGWVEYILTQKMRPTAKRHLWVDRLNIFFEEFENGNQKGGR